MSRSTVADVLADGLARAGARRFFATADAPAAVVAAARRRGVDVAAAADPHDAGMLAAVTGILTEAPGVVLAARAAPGLRAAVAGALRMRAPLVVVTGPEDDGALLAPATKATLEAEPASAAHWIAHAAQLALTHPRGPVHLAAPSPETASLPVATACRPAAPAPPSAAALDAVAAALATAGRPLLVTGLECNGDDAKWLRALAESLPAPVLATPAGRGVLPDPHPLALGALADDHPLLAQADLLVLVGVDEAELPPGVGLARAVRMARSGSGAHAPVAEAVGDVGAIIEELAPRLRGRAGADWDVAALDRTKRRVRDGAVASSWGRIVARARELTEAGALAAGELPLDAWQAVTPHEALAPPALPARRFAVPAAVAAALVDGERSVVAFTTDPLAGGLQTCRLLAGREARAVIVAMSGGSSALRERARDLGLAVLGADHENGFAAAFDRALAARRPALVVVPAG